MAEQVPGPPTSWDDPPDFRRAPVECLACGADCYELRGCYPGQVRSGLPAILGPLLPDAVVVRFHFPRGGQADLPACRPCAAALDPADPVAPWQRALAASERHFTALAESVDRPDWVAGIWAQTAALRARPPVRLEVLG